MGIEKYFQAQIDAGGGEQKGLFYGVETSDSSQPYKLEIKRHRESLDTLPTNLEFSRMATESIPVFTETAQS